MAFLLPTSALDTIRVHLAAEYPREGCGVLVGRDRGGERELAYAVPTRNADPLARRRFHIPPDELLAAEVQARARGLEVIGFYHSHPDTGALPSSSDLAGAWAYYTYLIAEVRAGVAGELVAWRANGDAYQIEPLRVVATTGVEP
jgi:proteasome lid subunit RPN8/RPN11